MKDVKKIRFVNLYRAADDQWVSLGGIRLYNGQNRIEPGALISEIGTTAEMEHMFVRAKSKYTNHYMVHHAVLTSRSQTGNYPSNGYWISADNENNAWYEIEFKAPKTIDRMEWVQKPDFLYDGRGTANPINIEFYREDGSLIERMTTQGNRTRNTITSLDLKRIILKFIVEDQNNLKYWAGSEWRTVPNTG